VVGVYEAHETVVDFGELVVVEGGRELGCFGESERFVTKDGERSFCNVKNPKRPTAAECFSRCQTSI
jgi:hypothetical protein